MTSRRVGTGVAAGLLLGRSAEVTFAQSLAGRVADETGGPLAAVSVVAVSAAGRHESVARTDADGRYQLQLPSVGTFDVRYTAPGFVEHRLSGVDVTEAEKSVDVTLQLTTFADQIQVAAELRETHSTGSRLGLTRRQTAVSRNGNLPPNAPEIVANLGTTVRPVSRVEAGFWLSHIGRRAADTANLVFQPAYTTIDPFVRVALGRAADLTLRVQNASDTRFVEWATRAFGVTNVYFGEPRRVIASLRVRL